MAVASVSGAIDYAKFDGSAQQQLREEITLTVLERERVFTWLRDTSSMHASLSRGLDWLKPKSAAKVSKHHIDRMEDVENRASGMYFPYIEKKERQDKDEDSLLDRYKAVFGGEPGSEEAEKTILAMKEQYLPKMEENDDNVVSGAIAAGNSRWTESMKPRKP
jgi:hypothetical protein